MCTHHLECGEVLLPPDELLVLRSHGGHHVVEVHDDVHERVQHREERAVAAYKRKKKTIRIRSAK